MNPVKTDIQSVPGLQIGNNSYALLDAGFDQQLKQPYIRHIIRTAPLYEHADDVFSDEFMHRTRQWQSSRDERNKAVTIYEQALAMAYGNYAAIEGFSVDDETQGLGFSYYYEPQTYAITSVNISPVMARADKQLSFTEANSLDGRNKETRLKTVGKFLLAQTLDLQQFTNEDDPGLLKKFIDEKFAASNYQSLSDLATVTTQRSAGDNCLQHGIGALMRLNKKELPRGYQSPLTYESTEQVLARGLKTPQFKTFLGVDQKISAILNSSALRHFHETGEQLFSSRQAQRLAELQHARHAIKVDFPSST